MITVRDFQCPECEHVFERFLRNEEQDDQKCPECDEKAKVLISAPKIDFTNTAMGHGCETAIRKWEIAKIQKAAQERKNMLNHGTPE